MGSLPDSKYIIKEDGYYYVYSHDVDPSKGYVTVSAKGIANGLSDRPNDDCDFGPDTYNPNHTGSGIPYTQTSGIQEALNYAYNNSVSLVDLATGVFKTSANITLPKGIAIVGKGYGNNDNDFYLQPAPPTNTNTILSGTWIIPKSSSVTAIITTNGNLPAQNRIENIRIEGMYLSDAGLDLNAGTEFPNDAISGLIIQNVAVTNCVTKNIDVSHSADLTLFNIHSWTKNTSGDFVLGVYDIVCNSSQSEVDMDNIFSYSPSGLSLSVDQWHCNNSIINAININGNYGDYYVDSSYLANAYQSTLTSYRINLSPSVTSVGNIVVRDSFVEVASGNPASIFYIPSGAVVDRISMPDSVVQSYSGTTNLVSGSGTIISLDIRTLRTFVQTSGEIVLPYVGSNIKTSAVLNTPVSTGTTEVMAGMGVTFTPYISGRIKVMVTVGVTNSTASDGVKLYLYYGTGTPPSSGASPTGSGFPGPGSQIHQQETGGPTSVILIGYADVGTSDTIWIDIAYNADLGGTATLQYATAIIEELT